MVLVQLFEYPGKQLLLELNHFLRTIDEPQFQVQRIVFGQMPTACVRFGTVDVPGLEYALKCGNPMFLVELRTLRQIGDAFKVLDRKEIAASFGSGSNDLRSN